MTNGNEPINYQLDWGNQGSKMEGLTKREYFAAMALQGLCSNPDWAKTIKQDDWDEYTDRLTSGSVDIADALIKELNKNLTPAT